jgi:pantoate kinase
MKAWVPSHITGFFAAKRQDDPQRSGSIGCGLALALGATTTIENCLETDPKTEIVLNGQVSEAPVSRYVVDKLARSPVKVKTELDMPLGAGFGASGAGALGVRLGMPVVEAGEIADRAEMGTGDEADVDFMQSAVGLVWRALLLWLLLLLLLGFASLVGS